MTAVNYALLKEVVGVYNEVVGNVDPLCIREMPEEDKLFIVLSEGPFYDSSSCIFFNVREGKAIIFSATSERDEKRIIRKLLQGVRHIRTRRKADNS